MHYQMYVHAPEYHWHVHAEVQTGADVEGRAAIEELHQRTHDFARDTVREVEALQQAVSSADQRAGSIEAVVGEMSTRVDQVSELATQVATALEAQADHITQAGEDLQHWQGGVDTRVADACTQTCEAPVDTGCLQERLQT